MKVCNTKHYVSLSITHTHTHAVNTLADWILARTHNMFYYTLAIKGKLNCMPPC